MLAGWISYKHLAALRPGQILSADFRNTTLVDCYGLPSTYECKGRRVFIANAYGINVENSGQVRPIEQISRATLDLAFDAVDDFRAACGQQLNLLINFLRGLDLGGNAAASSWL